MDALTATYSKYGKGQCVAAIKAIIYYDNFDLISNGNGSVKYRGALKMNVNKAELENFIRSTMIMLNPDNEKQPLGYLIDEFIRFFVSKDISKRFADACAVTLDKYGENWLADAIERYIENDDPRGFSRTSNNVDPENKDVNYRIEITKIDKDDCVMAMKSYLFEQGIDVSYLPGDTLYNMYVDALSRTRGNTVGSSAR